MYPSGYKEDKIYSLKPTDGSGDLTFTRASTATRVNAEGLIETASVLGSELITNGDFASDTIWVKGTGTTISGGKANLSNGTAVALYQNIGTQSGLVEVTFTVTNYTSGTLNVYSGSNQTATNINVVANALGIYTFNVIRTGGNENIIFGSLSNFTGSIDNVSIKEVITNNVPRIDYTGGGCGKLLLEPQRTNELQFSEQPDNVYWTKSGATILTNTINSPSGYVDADKLQEDSSTGVHRYGRATFPSGTQRTFSVFAKKGERNFVCLFENNSGSPQIKGVIFNLNTGALSLNNDPAYYTNPTIIDYGNGWYRCSATWTPTSLSVPSIGVSADGLTNSYAGTTGNGIYTYGAQLEAGSYVSSYVPTLASSVTRLADAAFKTGISSLIGTDFTVFFDGYQSTGGSSSRYLILKGSGGTYANAVFFESNPSRQVAVSVLDNSSSLVFGPLSTSLISGQRLKFALRCKNNDFAFYMNGVLQSAQASGTVPTTSDIYVGYYTDYTDNYNVINQTSIFNRGLTNAELATLTTL